MSNKNKFFFKSVKYNHYFLIAITLTTFLIYITQKEYDSQQHDLLIYVAGVLWILALGSYIINWFGWYFVEKLKPKKMKLIAMFAMLIGVIPMWIVLSIDVDINKFYVYYFTVVCGLVTYVLMRIVTLVESDAYKKWMNEK